MYQLLRSIAILTFLFASAMENSNGQTFYRSYEALNSNAGGVNKTKHTADGGFIFLTAISGANYQYLAVKTRANGTLAWSRVISNTTGLIDIIEAAPNKGYYIYGAGNNNFSITKIDANGSFSWAKNYAQTNGAAINSFGFCTTTEGGFLMGGGNCGLRDYIFKCDSLGNFLWGKEYKNSYSGGVITACRIIPSVNAGKYLVLNNDSHSTTGTFGCFEIDGTGNMSWYKTYTPTTTDYHTPLGITRFGNSYFILTAHKYQSSTEADYITKIDASGNWLWTKTYAVPNKLQTAGMAVNSKGDILVVGSEVTGTDPRYLAYMTDSTGNVQWKIHSHNLYYNGNFGDGFYDAAPTGGTSFFLGGGTSGERMTAAMITSTGSGMCNSSTATVTQGSATSTVGQPAITTATFSLNATAFTQTSIAYTLHDSVFCHTGVFTEVGGTSPQDARVSIFPNPAKGNICIEGEAITGFRLNDCLGRTVIAGMLNNGKNFIDLSAIAKGIYIMKVTSRENAGYVQKITVQ